MSLEAMTQAIPINWGDFYLDLDGADTLQHDFEIDASEFIWFARQDLKSDNRQGLVNALTNAKRAIDCQTDMFLACIGYPPNLPLPSNVKEFMQRINPPRMPERMPKGLRLLATLDVAPPLLISRIRDIRNLLEHEYKMPTEVQVDEAIEIARMYVGTVNSALFPFYGNIILGRTAQTQDADGRLQECVYIMFEQQKFQFEGRLISAHGGPMPKLVIKSDAPQYLDLIRLCISLGTRGDVDNALFHLLRTLNYQGKI